MAVDFYHGHGSPYSWRVWLALELKQVSYPLKVLSFASQGEYLMGRELTAADLVLYPNIAYCKRITFRKPEAKLAELIPPKLAAWAARIEALPYFDRTIPEHWRAGWGK